MAEPAQKTNTSNSRTASNDSHLGDVNSVKKVNEDITGRQSRELFIALCGPIGSGVHVVNGQLIRVLEDHGYEVCSVRVSKLIESASEKCDDIKISTDTKADRYNSLMDAGNKLRSIYGNPICANLAVREISLTRGVGAGISKEEDTDPAYEQIKERALSKRAYVIDQLKRPEEVKALKEIYRNNFYLIGVLCDEGRREVSLTSEGISAVEAHNLIQRDKEDNDSCGQQLEKTLFDADFFINKSNPNASIVEHHLNRFLKLIHGGSGVTPTSEEVGMYAAQSSSMQSACLSRQVGASILDSQGMILATGRNDVPKYGGGLYSEDDNVPPNSSDNRCVHRDQRCHNDQYKLTLVDKVKEVLANSIKDKDELDRIADEIYRKTPIKSLIEYSRAIHAEMDALISLVRSSKSIPLGCTLYTTTYPCHNCARHIIAAGIERIIYIEPYEKSLAIKLHDDALSHSGASQKVHIFPFQGVSPSRYQVFFSSTKPSKGVDGKIIISDKTQCQHVDKGYIDSYLDYELKVVGSLNDSEL